MPRSVVAAWTRRLGLRTESALGRQDDVRCGSAACEAHIKTDTQATIRNMPINGSAPSGHCIRCDNPAAAEAWFAKSY